MRRHYPSDGGRMKSGRELWLCYKEEEEEEGEEEMKKRGKEERERETKHWSGNARQTRRHQAMIKSLTGHNHVADDSSRKKMPMRGSIKCICNLTMENIYSVNIYLHICGAYN